MTLEIGLGCATLLSLGLPELIEVAARHGFPTITARPLSFVQALDDGFTEPGLRRKLADAGVRVSMVDCLNKGLPGIPPLASIDPTMRSRLPPDALNPPDQETVMRSAEALEAPWVNVSHFLGHVVPFEEMAEAIGNTCRRAAASGLGIALEFNPDTGLPDMGYAQRIAEACGEANCKITLDFWHLDRCGGDVADIGALPPSALAGLQLSDCWRPAPGAAYVPMSGRDLPGEGELPLGELVVAALANSPGICAEVEVFSSELQAMTPDQAAARVASALASWRTLTRAPE